MNVKRRTAPPLLLALASSLCLLALSPPAEARAADQVVAHDTMISSVYALDGDLVYYRRGPKATLPKRVWMRRVGGKLHRVSAIPRRAYAGDIGRDAKGRKVLTFQVQTRKAGTVLGAKWFVYDLARDRSRRVGGLPKGCVVGWYAVWRDSAAYTASCKNAKKTGVFVKQGKRTRKISSDTGAFFHFRDGFLEGNFDTGLDDFVIVQYTVKGKVCNKVVYPSYGDATSEDGWAPSGLWLGSGEMTWQMGRWSARPNFALLRAKLPSRCATPGSIREIPFTPAEGTLGARAVDGRRIFYTNGDGSTLRLHVRPAKLPVNRPANDDFEHAQDLPGDWPSSTTARTAFATVQPGEPLAAEKHTVWYRFRPTRSGTAYVSVEKGEYWDFERGSYATSRKFGVYTGTDREHLTEATSSSGFGALRIDAQPGQTYWISLASAFPEPNFQPFHIFVTAQG
jgi:hypothetical protein